MRSHSDLKNRIKYFRELTGLSQSQLAKLVGTSRNAISSYENGRFCPSAFTAALICVALDITFDDLFYFLEEGSNG